MIAVRESDLKVILCISLLSPISAEYIFSAVFWHINCLIRFRAPTADAIFFDVSVMCFFQDRFLKFMVITTCLDSLTRPDYHKFC